MEQKILSKEKRRDAAREALKKAFVAPVSFPEERVDGIVAAIEDLIVALRD